MKAAALILFFTFAITSGYSGEFSDSTKVVGRSRPRWYVPHYIPIQFAGNIGFLSIGIGYQARKDNYQFSLLYGFSPSSRSGAEIHTITGRNIFPITRFHLNQKQTLIPYGAAALSVEVGGRSFLTLPSNMPSGYYDFPKSIHLIVSAGARVRHITTRIKYLRGIEIFAEVSTVDAYLWYKFFSDNVKLHQITSLSLGVHLLRD